MKYLILFTSLLIFKNYNAQPFTLPQLKFNYSAYEPYIDGQTMEIHHSKHHQGYVNKLNKAIQGTKYESMELREILLNSSHLSDNIKNNAGGHYNHSLFWEILNPVQKNATPSKALKTAIDKSFGGLDSMKIMLGKSAAKQFGSGWAWLSVTPEKELAISNSPNQDNPIMDISKIRGIPIIGIDVWEHAYYLKYQNNRKDYLQNIWSLLDWKVISFKYNEALNDPYLKIINETSWQEMISFHIAYKKMKSALNQTPFKSPEELNDIAALSANLLAKAIVLVASERPEKYEKEDISKRIQAIQSNCESLYKTIKARKNDSVIKSKFLKLTKNIDYIIPRD
jgi:superoxide dismutase